MQVKSVLSNRVKSHSAATAAATLCEALTKAIQPKKYIKKSIVLLVISKLTSIKKSKNSRMRY